MYNCFRPWTWNQISAFMKLRDLMSNTVQLFSTLDMKLKQIYCEITWLHSQQYRIVFNFGHDVENFHLWDHVIICLEMYNCFQPWAWNQNNLIVKLRDLMSIITEFFQPWAWKKANCFWNHLIPYPPMNNCLLWNHFLGWILEIVNFEDF